MGRFYFTIEYLPVNVDVSLLAGRCINILHGFVCQNETTSIGVSFPGWTDQSLGKSIAFVSSSFRDLSNLAGQKYFRLMSRDGVFRTSEVKPVPALCNEIKFVRNQRIAKCFAGEKRRRLARAKRRAEERGDPFKPKAQVSHQSLCLFHRVMASSKSTNEQFILHIQKGEGTFVPSENYNNYGFASNVEYDGTVPDLSINY